MRTVAELRALLAEVPGELEVTVRWFPEDGSDGCGRITSVAVEEACRNGGAFLAIDCSDEDAVEPPYVCPGCHAVGGEPCAPWCIDAEGEREREEALMSGDYDRMDEDDG